MDTACKDMHSAGKRRRSPKEYSLTPGKIHVVVLLMAVLLALPLAAHAEYLITHGGTTDTAPCYWIERSMLYLCDGTGPIPLSKISAIDAGTMTDLEAGLHRDTIHRFFANLSMLAEREGEIVEQDRALAGAIGEVEELRKQPGKKKELKALRKRLKADVDEVQRRVILLKHAWESVRIPERDLVVLAEIKALQFLTWLQALQEREVFLETLDPSFREYALEHDRQAGEFRVMYGERLLQTDPLNH